MAFKQKRCRVSKHDRYVFELRDKIKHKYDFISTNVKVSGRNHEEGN